MKRFFLLLLSACILFASIPADAVCEDDSFTVAASFYPIYVFAQNVAYGTNTKVLCMTSNTVGCLHDYQLLPGDLTRLEGVNLLLINGAGMEQFQGKFQLKVHQPVIQRLAGTEVPEIDAEIDFLVRPFAHEEPEVLPENLEMERMP